MSPIRLLTSFDGTIGRAGFWTGSALVAGLLALVERFSAGSASAAEMTAFAGAFAMFPWAALGARRARDRGRPWLYGSLLVVAIVLLGLLAPMRPGDGLGGLSLVLWLLALVDLGLMPGKPLRPDRHAVARLHADAKPAR